MPVAVLVCEPPRNDEYFSDADPLAVVSIKLINAMLAALPVV